MLITRTGDIFEDPDALAIANPVNCHGAMGRGLALEFARKYPNILRPYRALCRAGTLKPGTPHLVATKGDLPTHIVLFPTKNHWRDPSKLSWIEEGLGHMYRLLDAAGISSVALPPLGAGLGNLDWPPVRDAITASAQLHPHVTTYLYVPR